MKWYETTVSIFRSAVLDLYKADFYKTEKGWINNLVVELQDPQQQAEIPDTPRLYFVPGKELLPKEVEESKLYPMMFPTTLVTVFPRKKEVIPSMVPLGKLMGSELLPILLGKGFEPSPISFLNYLKKTKKDFKTNPLCSVFNRAWYIYLNGKRTLVREDSFKSRDKIIRIRPINKKVWLKMIYKFQATGNLDYLKVGDDIKITECI